MRLVVRLLGLDLLDLELVTDSPDHSAFDAFKRRTLSNPEVRKAYVDARIRTLIESKKPS